MVHNLKVNNGSILNDARLTNLGKINVICGKNNSGKTTLLEAINEETNRRVGITLSKEFSDELVTETKEKMRMPVNRKEYIVSGLMEVIEKNVTSWNYLFQDEVDDFLHDLYVEIEKHNKLDNRRINMDVLKGNIKQRFDDNFKSILIPPKRNLEINSKANSDRKAEANGLGVVEQLFFLQSQVNSAEEYKIYQGIMSAFHRISGGYKFHISIGEQNSLSLRFSEDGKSWVNADVSGLGLQDLLILLYFNFMQEFELLLIEEPESHIHPEMQRRLLHYFSEESDKQLFFTTHSNIFLDNAYVNRVFFTSFSNEIEVDDATSRASVLSDLGYSVTDNLISDLVILVEGPTDSPVIEEYLKKYGIYGDYDIKIWPLGGDIMDQLDLSVFTDNYNIFAIVDNDPGSGKVRRRFVKNCRNEKIPVRQLKSYSIENYFTVRVLKEIFGSQIPKNVEEIKPDEKLEEQIGINVKKNNRRLAELMTVEELEGTDIERIMRDIRKKLKGN